jgi:hypothetical protein
MLGHIGCLEFIFVFVFATFFAYSSYYSTLMDLTLGGQILYLFNSLHFGIVVILGGGVC